MVESHSGRRLAVLFLIAAFLVLFLGRFLKPVNNIAVTVSAPFAAVISTVANTAGDSVTGITQGARFRDENVQLKKQLAHVLSENAVLQQGAHENALLRSLLRFDVANTHMRFVTARVIGQDPNSLAPYLLINKGARDGLRTGMTVVADQGYFVGTIYELDATASKIQLMTSPSSSVGALDLRTHATGLVEGKYAALPVLDNVVTSATLHAGDFVVTSGQLNLFPRTILLGQIVRVHHSNDSLFQTADLQPAVDLNNLEIVQVIRNFAPSAPTHLLRSH